MTARRVAVGGCQRRRQGVALGAGGVEVGGRADKSRAGFLCGRGGGTKRGEGGWGVGGRGGLLGGMDVPTARGRHGSACRSVPQPLVRATAAAATAGVCGRVVWATAGRQRLRWAGGTRRRHRGPGGWLWPGGSRPPPPAFAPRHGKGRGAPDWMWAPRAPPDGHARPPRLSRGVVDAAAGGGHGNGGAAAAACCVFLFEEGFELVGGRRGRGSAGVCGYRPSASTHGRRCNGRRGEGQCAV